MVYPRFTLLLGPGRNRTGPPRAGSAVTASGPSLWGLCKTKVPRAGEALGRGVCCCLLMLPSTSRRLQGALRVCCWLLWTAPHVPAPFSLPPFAGFPSGATDVLGSVPLTHYHPVKCRMLPSKMHGHRLAFTDELLGYRPVPFVPALK